MFRYPLELHLVHINSKYVNADGSLDGGYATNADGLAVIGFLFKIDKRKVTFFYENYHELEAIRVIVQYSISDR